MSMRYRVSVTDDGIHYECVEVDADSMGEARDIATSYFMTGGMVEVEPLWTSPEYEERLDHDLYDWYVRD